MCEVGALADPDDRRPAGPDERQAPLGSNRRRRERLCKRHTGPVGALLLGPAPDHPRIGWGPFLQELTAAALRLEQDELPARQAVRERDPGRAVAGADVDDRAVIGRNEVRGTKRIFEQCGPGLLQVERGQPRGGNDSFEPALELVGQGR